MYQSVLTQLRENILINHFWRDTGEILKRYWRDTVEILGPAGEITFHSTSTY